MGDSGLLIGGLVAIFVFAKIGLMDLDINKDMKQLKNRVGV